ncbi:DUF2017 family protein [Actinomarinicola tropica]|uniref:DUF2017 family protein n=1 Tax=Actinomarinicola tropica TaxID=2789776 RepID=A0A5Q2RLL7_9ACTN|nr:DUF2017 family protein [Actinomarinicola tropica]QGG96733.1 DUF2017 family protein [Actinomarinicola tropica]
MGRDGGFGFFDERWVRPAADDRYELAIPSGVQAMVLDLIARLDELLHSDADVIRRVFPTAYPDDPEREAGFQALVRGELIDRHLAAAQVIADTIREPTLDEAQLTSWMTALNAVRLILGTALDVQDDEPMQVDLDSEEGPAQMAYQVLSELVDDIVTALRTRL